MFEDQVHDFLDQSRDLRAALGAVSLTALKGAVSCLPDSIPATQESEHLIDEISAICFHIQFAIGLETSAVWAANHPIPTFEQPKALEQTHRAPRTARPKPTLNSIEDDFT